MRAYADMKARLDVSQQTVQITFMTLLHHAEFAGAVVVFFSPRSNHVTFYSNMTDVEVMIPSTSRASQSTGPASPVGTNTIPEGALIEMISILLSRLMMDELAAAGTFDKPLSAGTAGTE